MRGKGTYKSRRVNCSPEVLEPKQSEKGTTQIRASVSVECEKLLHWEVVVDTNVLKTTVEG